MTDPMEALKGLQSALDAGTVQLQRCDLHSDIQVLLDDANGTPRFTYAQIDEGKVLAVAILILVQPIEGVRCFQLGYAVTESMRGKGIGSGIVKKAIDEFENGLGRTAMKEFFIEAIVSDGNVASNQIAKQLISDSPEACTDFYSKEPAYQYLRRFRLQA